MTESNRHFSFLSLRSYHSFLLYFQLQLATIAHERKFIRLPRFTADFCLSVPMSFLRSLLTAYIFKCMSLACRVPLSRAFSRLSPCGTISCEIAFLRQAHSPTISHRQAIPLSRCKWRKKSSLVQVHKRTPPMTILTSLFYSIQQSLSMLILGMFIVPSNDHSVNLFVKNFRSSKEVCHTF